MPMFCIIKDIVFYKQVKKFIYFFIMYMYNILSGQAAKL